MSEEMITITKAEYDELIQNYNFMQCLERAGVDNWDGYEYAIELYSEIEKEWEDE